VNILTDLIKPITFITKQTFSMDHIRSLALNVPLNSDMNRRVKFVSGCVLRTGIWAVV